MSPAGSYGPLGARFDLIPRTAASHTYESSPEPTDPFYFGPSTPEFQYQDAFVGNNFSGSRSPACSEGTVSLVGAWSNDEQIMFGNPADMFVQMPHYLPQQTPVHGHIRSTSTQSQPELYASLDSQHPSPDSRPQLLDMQQNMYLPQEKTADSPSPMLSAPLPTPPASSSLPTHDCTLSAFQTLNSLYAPSGALTPGGSPTLECILSTNKAAVDTLYALLNCDCTSTPHFSSTINLAIMKILSWHQAIARAHDPRGLFSPHLDTHTEVYTAPPPAPPSHHASPDTTTSSDTECARRTNLVLSELCRIEKLIDRFAERYCQYMTGGSNAAAKPDSASGVHLAMEASLRTRVRDTFRVTMAVAPESVKRRLAAASRTSTTSTSSMTAVTTAGAAATMQSRVRVNTV